MSNYTYNALGEVLSKTDAKNQLRRFTYDKLGRQLSRIEPTDTTNWTYDTATKGKGGLASVTMTKGSEVFVENYTYDSLSRPSSTTRTVTLAGQNHVFGVSRTYDSASRIKKLTYPNSFAVEHVYNSRGYLEAVRSDRADSSGRKMEYWRAAPD